MDVEESPSMSSSAASSPTALSEGAVIGEPLPTGVPNGASTTSKKRKKRKKKAAAPVTLDESDDPVLREAEAKIFADDEEAWRSRARLRLDRLRAVVRDSEELRREAADAAHRFADAEHAERLVSAGLRSAHALLAEREKALATATTEAANLNAQVGTLKDENKKYEKRLVLLKTVGERLQEARSACDASELRLEEANTHNADLRRSIATLEENLATQGAEVKSMKAEISELIETHERSIQSSKLEKEMSQRRVHAARLAGAGVGFVASIVLRALLKKRPERKDSD